MNNNVSPMWHQNQGAVNGGPDLNDDFSSFLNFNEMPLNMSSPFENTGEEHMQMDTEFCLDGNNAHQSNNDVNQQIPQVTQAEIMDMQFHEMQKSMEAAHQQMMRQQQIQQQQQQQQQQHHNHHQHNNMIPPTPSSMEMHAGLPQSTLHNMNSHMMMERFNMYREEPMIFTPLVSPAVTPLETEFTRHIPDFVMPGAFSPLTSPALNAHHHRSHMPNPHMPQSPALHDGSQSPILGKKGSISAGRRKSTTSRNPARVVRESPSMKPQRKRPPPPTPLAAAPQTPTTLAAQSPIYPAPMSALEAARRESITPAVSQQNTPMQHPRSQEGSSNESVSPEPLPEVLMAPPPRRSISARSPTDDTPDVPKLNAPVTPASLMRLPKTSLPTEDIPPISMDTSEYLNRDVQQTAESMMNGRHNSEEMPTPTMAANRTPSLTPSLRPARRDSRHTSPLEPQNTGGITKKEPARNTRKRGSVSSSPALQPKISPHIKPLLPIGMSPDASAFLLASKSNYQNIVEGNHSHLGLQYPEHLSTNLTSKRTSHKIAEQGRRNRINNALAEMAGLLPPLNGGAEGGATKEQTSKASTVELAIEYIKQLKQELDETKNQLRVAEEKLESLSSPDNPEESNPKPMEEEKQEEMKPEQTATTTEEK